MVHAQQRADRAHIQPLAVVEVEIHGLRLRQAREYIARRFRFGQIELARMLAKIFSAQILRLIVKDLLRAEQRAGDRGLVHVELLGDLRRGLALQEEIEHFALAV